MTQFDTDELVLERQHTDTIFQPGNNGNDDRNNKSLITPRNGISHKQLIIRVNGCIWHFQLLSFIVLVVDELKLWGTGGMTVNRMVKKFLMFNGPQMLVPYW